MLALFAICVAALGYFIMPRAPKDDAPAAPVATGWNPAAVRGTLAGIQVREVDPNHAAIVFSYDVDNQTDADYQLTKGPNAVILSRLKSDGTLVTNDALQLDNSISSGTQSREDFVRRGEAVSLARRNWSRAHGTADAGKVSKSGGAGDGEPERIRAVRSELEISNRVAGRVAGCARKPRATGGDATHARELE